MPRGALADSRVGIGRLGAVGAMVSPATAGALLVALVLGYFMVSAVDEGVGRAWGRIATFVGLATFMLLTLVVSIVDLGAVLIHIP